MTVARFRKKPVVIEAVQFNGTNHVSIGTWMVENGGQFEPSIGYMSIPTLEGVMRANKGDWIIKGVQGEFYPYRNDIFEATYEAVEE